MKYLFLLSILGIFSQSTWEEFVSLDGKFKVWAPAALTEKIDSVQTDVGTLAYHTFFHQTNYQDETDNIIYMVSFCDYPEGIIFADSTGLATEFFDETMTAAAETVGGEILYSTDIQLKENLGKQWRIDYLDGNAFIKTKAYLVENRYYSIQVISTKKQSLSSQTNQFLDSFELL